MLLLFVAALQVSRVFMSGLCLTFLHKVSRVIMIISGVCLTFLHIELKALSTTTHTQQTIVNLTAAMTKATKYRRHHGPVCLACSGSSHDVGQTVNIRIN